MLVLEGRGERPAVAKPQGAERAPRRTRGAGRKGLARSLALVLLFGVATLAVGARAGATELTPQQKEFVKAERAVKDGAPVRFEELRSYVLYPYLVYRGLQRRFEAGEPVEDLAPAVRSFMERYSDSSLAEKLRTDWLGRLARAGSWGDVLKDYRPSTNIELDCLHRQALLETGQTSKALDGIERVWMRGSSLPGACDPVLRAWRDRGGFTRDRVWKRFEMALANGEQELPLYLRSLLPEPDQAAADVRLQAYDERKRALDLATGRDPQGARRLAELPESVVDAQVREWRVRVPLRDRNWPEVRRWLDRLLTAERQTPRWRYWRARALEATGRGSEAFAIFRDLAQAAEYHGFLAADRMGDPYAIASRPVAASQADLDDLLGRSVGLQRARELLALDRKGPARSEWLYALDRLATPDVKIAARLAQSWGWHHQSVRTAARAGEDRDLELRFPIGWRADVLGAAAEAGVDPAWVYAVILQESQFQTDARSGKNALGLMQLLPETARIVAGRLQLADPGEYGLLNPATNIRFGASFLRSTLDRLQGNPALATAGYNAGPLNAYKWLPQSRSIDADVWTETIPYRETRRYVQRVAEHAVIYAWRLGRRDRTMSSFMQTVRPAVARGG